MVLLLLETKYNGIIGAGHGSIRPKFELLLPPHVLRLQHQEAPAPKLVRDTHVSGRGSRINLLGIVCSWPIESPIDSPLRSSDRNRIALIPGK